MNNLAELFTLFHQHVETRIHRYGSFTAFGEDSVRYDFYHSLIEVYRLKPEDLILEQPIPPSQFAKRQKSPPMSGKGRKEDKPEFDLRVDAFGDLHSGILAEFAYFRSTDGSANQARTERMGKLFNEICRLALLKNFRNAAGDLIYKDFSSYRCLLICISDEEMMEYLFERIPRLNENKLVRLDTAFLKTAANTARLAIKPIFYDKLKELDITPVAKKVFEMEGKELENGRKWETWIWEIDFVEA